MADTIPDWWADANTQRGREIATQQAQRTFGGNVAAGFKDTALSAGMVLTEQEVQPLVEESGGSMWNPIDRLGGYAQAIMGYRAGGAQDYSDQHETLTTGVPMEFWDEILDEPNLAAAQRARARVDEQLQRAQISAQQQGLSQNLALMAGSVVDVDAPLMLMTGGGFKAAQVARTALRAGRSIGLSPKAAMRMSSAAIGANAGMQAGAIAGAATVAMRETADWTVVAESALLGMAMGGAINPILRGDTAVSIRAARDELHTRVATDDPSLTATAYVDPAGAAPLRPGVFEYAQESAVGAQQATPTARHITPISGVDDTVRDMSEAMDNWRHDSGWQDAKDAAAEEWWTRVATAGALNIATGNWRALYTSKASGMNWMLGNVFESPNGLGRGRYTAATGMEMYHRQIAQTFAQPAERAAKSWARRMNATGPLGNPTQAGLAAFNREVMLERNNRAMGRTTPHSTDPDVIKAANAYDAAAATSFDIATGRAGQTAVDGFDNLPPKANYSPQIWNGRRLLQLERDGIVRRSDVIDAIATAYRNAGMLQAKDAKAIAKAVVDRAAARGDNVDTNLIGLMSGDGREWLHTALEASGMPVAERDGLMKRLLGEAAERGKESFAKSRNDVDMAQSIPTTDGSDLRIVDLLDTDLHGVWQRYSRKMAGAAALARVGLRNKLDVETAIQAIHAQQRALGEELVDPNMLRAMFSHFRGGPIHGWSAISGRIEEGVMPEVALVKRATNLSLLGKLGFAQAAETGAGIVAGGFKNWWTRTKMELGIDLSNKELLDDLAFITGNIGDDHRLFAEHLDLDDMNASDRGALMRFAQGVTQKGQYYQSFLSGFNTVRSFQQRVAAAAVIDRLMRTVRDNAATGIQDAAYLRRLNDDLGIDNELLTYIETLVGNGTIEFASHNGHTFVNRLNIDKWDTKYAMDFGAGIERNLSQIVQRSLAGEQDTWMHTTVGSLITHLKTFPLLALQKQFIRNARHSDSMALNTMLMGVATAGVAIAVRDAMDGRERSMGELATAAFGYSNMTGWVPMYTDPLMTALGMEDYRINQWGPHSQMSVPALDWVNRAGRLPGAVADTVSGQGDWHDEQSLKALPFSNLIGLSRMF